MTTSHTEKRSVPCDSRVVQYHLTRKAVKNINLRIKPDGKILVSASDSVPIEFIDDFIRKKQEYIIRSLEKYEENQRYVSVVPKRYVSGESYEILGKSLRLKVMEGEEEKIWTDGVYIFLVVKDKESLNRKKLLVNDWLRNLQLKNFEKICIDTYQIFKKYDISYPEIKIRHMTSRWGSCQPKRGIITLNSRLIEVPRNCIEYVVLHEFAHFIHPNHSKQFYDFIAMLMPDWKERKEELEKRL